MLKKRHIKITIGDNSNIKIFESKMEPNNMRIDFEIKKYANNVIYGLNTANIEIYNLNSESFKNFKQKYTPIIVEAGYEGYENIIFNGRISNALLVKKNPTDTDVITNLLCMSGIGPIQNAIYTKDFSKKSANSPSLEIKQFIRNMCNDLYYDKEGQKTKLNINVTIVSKLDGTVINGYVRPQSFNGNILDTLKSLGEKFEFTFQIGETEIVIRPREIKPTYEITPENGLIGIPEITELGIDIKTFLNPLLDPGDAFTLNSQYSNFKLGALEYLDRLDTTGTYFNTRKVDSDGRYQGSYLIIELTHKGSSHTNEWETSIVAQNYKATYLYSRGL